MLYWYYALDLGVVLVFCIRSVSFSLCVYYQYLVDLLDFVANLMHGSYLFVFVLLCCSILIVRKYFHFAMLKFNFSSQFLFLLMAGGWGVCKISQGVGGEWYPH